MILLLLALAIPQQPLPQTVQAHCGPNKGSGSIGITSCLVTCPTSYTLKPGTMTCELEKPPVSIPSCTIATEPGKPCAVYEQDNIFKPYDELAELRQQNAMLVAENERLRYTNHLREDLLQWTIAGYDAIVQHKPPPPMPASLAALDTQPALPKGPYRVRHKTFSCKRHPEKCKPKR